MTKLVRYDRRIFWRWLNEQPDGAIIGMNGDSSQCPLKKCFGQGPDERGYRVPQWADEYLLYIDTCTAESNMPVTKEDGLRAWHKTFGMWP